MKFSALVILFAALACSAFGQKPVTLDAAISANPDTRQRCGTTALHKFHAENDPGYAQRRAEIESFTQEWIENSPNRKTAAVVTIPIVVHVVYANATQNISDAQILSQIDVLNQDFRRLNADTANTPMDFDSIAGDVEIEFCLATVDPMGNATTGITRTSTTTSEIGNGGVHYTAQGGKDGWDPTQYMNFWICEITNGGFILGYATPPGTAAAAEDGCVMDYRFFGTMGTVQAPFNLGRTTTHEVGHYFNLEHIWGLNGGCSDDDLVADTPDQSQENYGCPSHPSMSCSSADMFMNFMDYVDDNCMNSFTNGQGARMAAAINGPRASLLTSSGCNPTVDVENAIGTSVTLYPNPTQGLAKLDLQMEVLQDVELNVYSIHGQQILHQAHRDVQSQVFELDLSGFTQGIYLVEVKTASEKLVKRLIIQ